MRGRARRIRRVSRSGGRVRRRYRWPKGRRTVRQGLWTRHRRRRVGRGHRELLQDVECYPCGRGNRGTAFEFPGPTRRFGRIGGRCRGVRRRDRTRQRRLRLSISEVQSAGAWCPEWRRCAWRMRWKGAGRSKGMLHEHRLESVGRAACKLHVGWRCFLIVPPATQKGSTELESGDATSCPNRRSADRNRMRRWLPRLEGSHHDDNG